MKRLYRPLLKLDRFRYREVLRQLLRKVSRKWSSTAEVSRRYQGITHKNQEQKLDRSTRRREVIEEARAFSTYPPGIEKLSR